MEHHGSVLSQISRLEQRLDKINEALEKEVRRTGVLSSDHRHLLELEAEALKEQQGLLRALVVKDAQHSDRLSRLEAVCLPACSALVSRLHELRERIRLVIDVVRSRIGLTESSLVAKERTRDNLCLKMEHERDMFARDCKMFQRLHENSGQTSCVVPLRGKVLFPEFVKDFQGVHPGASEEIEQHESACRLAEELEMCAEMREQLQNCMIGMQLELPRLQDEERHLEILCRKERDETVEP